MQTHPIQFSKLTGQSSGHTLSHGTRYIPVHARSSGDKKHDALVKETQKWVAQTFYGELLKEMRSSPFKDKIMSGGRGGQAFTEMFDQRLADHMATGAGKKLVDAIVNKIESAQAKNAYAKQSRLHKHHHPSIDVKPAAITSMFSNGAAA